jgi:2-oxoglutarate ferredoxin oxidoreductase subunit alpha
MEAVERLNERGIIADYMRVRAFPFVPEVRAFLHSYDRVFVVEQNRDGQLASLLAIETGFPRAHLEQVGTFGGMPLSARDVVDPIVAAGVGPRRTPSRNDQFDTSRALGTDE